MKASKHIAIMLTSFALLACQHTAQYTAQYTDTSTQTKDSTAPDSHSQAPKPQSVKDALALIIAYDWQFLSGENLNDDALKTLNDTVSLSFSPSAQRGELHDPDYDLEYQYYMTINANCNQNVGVIGFDKHSHQLAEIKGSTFTTLMLCIPDHEGTLRAFFHQTGLHYHVSKTQLSFTDNSNQTLIFKAIEK